jgi:excinuclease ABC subunit A
VIKTADWVIDMGPEGGTGGGLVVAEGTPEQVAVAPGSHTGAFLLDLLADRLSDTRPDRAAAPARKRSAKGAPPSRTSARRV